ncbi:MAG: cysteine desulfurase family protein [Thermoanaerobaculia bacterium]
MIYLDNNATTRVADEVVDAMTPAYREIYGNPHSPHALGRAAHDLVENARSEVARLLGARAESIAFTSCGTESNALVLRSFASRADRPKIVTTAVEHPSVLAMLHELAGDGSIELEVTPVTPDGALDLDAMRDAVDDGTALVSVMLAQNETGVIHDVAAVAAIAHEHGALVHVDAVQAAGKVAIDVDLLGADLLSISGHKFHAPKGIGALFIRRGIALEPIWRGGGQENGLRSGTEPVPLIAGLGRACSLALELLPHQKEVQRHRDRLEERVLASGGDVRVNGAAQTRLPNTASMSFRGLRADHLVAAFDTEGICCSAGAACHSGRAEPSGVMLAMGTPRDYAVGTVRFSLSRYTTGEEIHQAAGRIIGTLSKLHAAAGA